MHTLLHRDYNDIWIHHHGDWSGEAEIVFKLNGVQHSWKIGGRALCNGRFQAARASVHDAKTGAPTDQVIDVPVRIIAAAVSLAARDRIAGGMMSLAEEL